MQSLQNLNYLWKNTKKIKLQNINLKQIKLQDWVVQKYIKFNPGLSKKYSSN